MALCNIMYVVGILGLLLGFYGLVVWTGRK